MCGYVRPTYCPCEGYKFSFILNLPPESFLYIVPWLIVGFSGRWFYLYSRNNRRQMLYFVGEYALMLFRPVCRGRGKVRVDKSQ
ncbi:hypothetical protein BP00DRAFT_35037 [Aspergillus indologenus CBS 114.80]|uniref:Uncharacterized protein n=1 Tax=Aspergillus indologenus CBS 114.80 TaxID=1450541 RepID=A0A2V5HWL7_9EURO|nr:hypothetical protein BP00DRAFT_35037 [Aspergillus indologenus CBS 114.80]